MPDPSLPTPDQEPWTTVLKIAPGVALAILGAAVRLLRGTDPFSFRAYVAGMTTAAFAGLLVAYYLEWANVNPHLRIVIVGIAGYVARDVLDAAARYARKWLKNKVNEVPTQPHRKPARNDDDAGSDGDSDTLPPSPAHPSGHASKPGHSTTSGISLTIHVDTDAPQEARNAAAKAAKVALDADTDVPFNTPPTKPKGKSMRTPRPE